MKTSIRFFRSVPTRLAFLALSIALFALPASALEILVLSNRPDLVSGGDALVEVVPAPAAGSVIDLDGADISSDFALRPNGRFMGLVTGLAVGSNVLTVTEPGGSGAVLAIENHPISGPLLAGPHLQPWDCTTDANGFGPPLDANCNVAPKIEYLYKSVGGGGYQAYDLNNPPLDVANVTTDQGNTVRNIIRRESGAVNRGLYAIAVLHDPAISLDPSPWNPQPGFNGKLHYPFGASCNTNQTQGSDKTGVVTDVPRLERGYAVATTSLNELGHHCNPVLSAETVIMTKEIVIEGLGPLRWTTAVGSSGGAIGQLVVSNAFPGLLNGLLPGLTYPGIWSNAMEVGDCLLLELYWPKNPSFTPAQRAAVDGHGLEATSGAATTCATWVALFAPSGYPTTGCFSGSTLPATSVPQRDERDYDPILNPDGCRASTHDMQINVIGRRTFDDFAKFPLANMGVQYGLAALNKPITDPGKITFAQFLDLNTRIGSTDIDGIPRAERWRMAQDASRNVHRSSLMNDASNLDHVAIIDSPSSINEEIHTPYHSYAIRERLIAANGHGDNHVIWRGLQSLTGTNTSTATPSPFDTLDAWLTNIEANGGLNGTGPMDPAVIVASKPANAVDSCYISGVQVTDQATCDAQYPVYADARIVAGMPLNHDVIECELKPIDPADYAGAVPALTAADLLALQTVFPEGVCDYSLPSRGKEPAVPWQTYENGPGGEPLGAAPSSTTF